MAKKSTKKTRAAKSAQPVRKKRRQRKTNKPPAAKSQPKPAQPELIIGYDAIGNRYAVTSRTIQAWVKKGMPTANKTNPRKFNPADTDPWVEQFRADNPQPGKSEDEADRKKREARTRREIALANMAERDDQVAAGQLLSLEDYELFATETITAARDRLLRLPKDFKRQLCRKCQSKISELEEQLRVTLERLAKLSDGPDGKRPH